MKNEVIAQASEYEWEKERERENAFEQN